MVSYIMEATMWAPVNGAIMEETISFCCSYYGAHLPCDYFSYYIIGKRKKKQPQKSWCEEQRTTESFGNIAKERPSSQK